MTYIGPRFFALAFGFVCALFLGGYVILDRLASTFESTEPTTVRTDGLGVAPMSPASTAVLASSRLKIIANAPGTAVAAAAGPTPAPARARLAGSVAARPSVRIPVAFARADAPARSRGPVGATSSVAVRIVARKPADVRASSPVAVRRSRPAPTVAVAGRRPPIARTAVSAQAKTVAHKPARPGRPESPDGGILVPVGRSGEGIEAPAPGDSILIPLKALRVRP